MDKLSHNLAEVGTDTISRQAAIDYCYQLINVEHQQGSDETSYGRERVNQTEAIMHHLEVMSSAQPMRKKGRWKRRLVDSGFNADWYCSECGWKTAIEEHGYNYCPNCGAKMGGGDS